MVLINWQVIPSSVCAENSDSDILVVHAADQGMRYDTSDPVNWAREWRILSQGTVCSRGIVIAGIAF